MEIDGNHFEIVVLNLVQLFPVESNAEKLKKILKTCLYQHSFYLMPGQHIVSIQENERSNIIYSNLFLQLNK